MSALSKNIRWMKLFFWLLLLSEGVRSIVEQDLVIFSGALSAAISMVFIYIMMFGGFIPFMNGMMKTLDEAEKKEE